MKQKINWAIACYSFLYVAEIDLDDVLEPVDLDVLHLLLGNGHHPLRVVVAHAELDLVARVVLIKEEVVKVERMMKLC